MAKSAKIADQPDRRIKLARFVRNVSRPEWGLGIVLSENDTNITAFFERAGAEAFPFTSLQRIDHKAVPENSRLWDLLRSEKPNELIGPTVQATRSARHGRPVGPGFRKHGPGVLFVNIGWSVRYDGSPVKGGHGWFKLGRAQENGSSEDTLFLKQSDGCHFGPLGVGFIHPLSRLDVVYVARAPEGGHKVVALFRNARWEVSDPATGWTTCRSDDVTCLKVRQRPLVRWPGHMSMRRWALNGPSKNWRHLLEEHRALVKCWGE
jgi:Protein of unknown function (DUF3553)